MKVKKILRQQLNAVSIPEIKIEAKSNEAGLTRTYAILGGFLYVDEKPVQHYFSKNMFFYETDEEQGSIFLAHHGLMADVVIRRNGQTVLCKASTMLHYEMDYTVDNGQRHLDASFGMSIDSSKKAYFYCGLKLNGKEIIPVPSGEEEQKNQKILSLSYEEKTGNLITKWDTAAYALIKDKDNNPVNPDFKIFSMELKFDALYKNCDATIIEKEEKLRSFRTDQVSIIDKGSVQDCFKGECDISYTSDGVHVLKLFNIDCFQEKDESRELKKYYYCGVEIDGKEIIPIPQSSEEKKKVNFLLVSLLNGKWVFNLDGGRAKSYLEEKGEATKISFIPSVTVVGQNGSVTENKSEQFEYKTNGKLVVSDKLNAMRSKRIQNANAAAALKERCLELQMNQPPLTLEQLCSINPPSVIVSTTDENGKVVETPFDGQQYCSYKSSELIMDLVNYYAGDISNSDGNMKFSDLFGKSRTASLEAVNSVSPHIITEIENDEDPKNHLQKGYMKEFLKKIAPIILSGSLAKRTESQIVDGFGGAEKENTALIKSRFYLSYLPKDNEEDDNEKQVLATQVEYHHLSAIIDKYVYLSINPELNNYLYDKTTDYEDQREGQSANEYWAERMYYNYVETIQLLHMNYAVNPAWVTNIIKVLGILDSKSHTIKESINGDPVKDSAGNIFESSYSLALYAKLADYNIIQMIDTFKGEEDFENYIKLLAELYGSFYDKVKTKEITLPDDVQKDIQKFMEESQEVFVEWAILQAQEMMQFMIASGSMSSALLTYNPSTPALAKLFSSLNILVGAASFANIFMNWDSMNVLEKTESILSVLQSGFTITRNFILWKTVNTIFDPSATEAERMNAFYRYQVGGGSFDTLDSVSFHSGDPFNLKDSVEENATRYARRINGGEYANIALEKSSKCFVCAEITFQALNVALMGIAFVVQVMELDKIFKNKGSYGEVVVALSVVNTILTGVSMILGAAEFILGFTTFATCFAVASVLPITNAILMGAMFVISIVMMIIHKDPVQPLTLLIREKIASAVEMLDQPSQAWINANTPTEAFVS